MAVVAAVAGAGCKGERKREIGLAHRDGGPPVVIVEQPTESGAVGPLEREKEPNDQRDQAAALPLPGGVNGALASADDIDFYRIEAGAARAVVIRLTGPAADEGGVDLVLELHDADGKVVARSDRGPAGTMEGLPGAPLAARAVYFASVTQLVKKGRPKKKKKPAAEDAGAAGGAAGAATYQLTIDAPAPGADDEVEPNDKPEAAGQVLLSEEKAGYLGWSKDVDLWKLSLVGFGGGFALDLAVTGVDGAALAVDVLAPDGRVIAARKGQKDRALMVRGLLPELGAPFYLARVSGSRSNPEMAYHLRASSRALGDGDEAEPNDDPDRAIAAGTLGDGATGERRGYLDGGDTDVYKFEAGREAVGLTVSVDAPASTDVVLRVLGPGGAELASADNGKAGQREEIASLAVGRGEIRFVSVSGAALGDEADPYVLRWTSAVNLPGQGTQGAPTDQPTDQPTEPPTEDPYEQ
ncbi:MAG TPA: PT domain-containing protein [Kofleriaceae bacterium]|nr:PT domain-containing protein [Kofleriaceae bacterium]